MSRRRKEWMFIADLWSSECTLSQELFKYLRGWGYDMPEYFVWCQFDNDNVEGC